MHSPLLLSLLGFKMNWHIPVLWKPWKRRTACSVEVTCIVTVIILENMFWNIKSVVFTYGGIGEGEFCCWACMFADAQYLSPLEMYFLFNFFLIWVFFHNHSQITRLQGNGAGNSSTPHYYFHLLHRHLDISDYCRELTSKSSRTRTGNLWFPSKSF